MSTPITTADTASTTPSGGDLRVASHVAPAKDAFSAHAADRAIEGTESGPDVSAAGRKACTVMKVVSAVILAVAVSPGGDSDDAAIDTATRTLLARAADLANAALPLLGERGAGERGATMRNQLRQYAADTVSLQWRLAHSTGYGDLSVDQIMRIYREVDRSSFIDEVDAAEDADPAMGPDMVAARRVALLAVTTELHNAVGNFDYFHPDPAQLVEAGVKVVARLADAALAQLLPPGLHDEATRSAFTRIFLERAGTLYAQNFRAIARKDVGRIAAMDEQERLRFLHENRVGGLPTAHIERAYEALMSRMVRLILDASPVAAPEVMDHSNTVSPS